MSTPRAAFRSGLIAGLPFVLVVIPFAMLFGVIATEAGFDLLQTMAMSFLVVAGASQFVAVQLLVEQAPTLIILATALAVNMRMLMYSASIAPHLGAAPLWQRALAAYVLVDQSYALSHARFEAVPEMSIPQRVAYYFGACTLVMIFWFGCSYAGAALGTALPADLPLDFALPIAFLSMVAPMLRTLPHLAAAATAIVLSLLAVDVPHSLGLLIGGIGGMIAGAQTELWLGRRRA